MSNKVIARYADGRVIKGRTYDFRPGQNVFHMKQTEPPGNELPLTIQVRDLKLLAFVKELDGDPAARGGGPMKIPSPGGGRKIQVTFKDGEVLVGTTTSYNPGRPGFFIEPGAWNANETRIYVVIDAIHDVRML
jgi:hypothetical protein